MKKAHRLVIIQEEDYPDGSTYYARFEVDMNNKEEVKKQFDYLADYFDKDLDEDTCEEGFYGT
jgi:hypothetical protein